MKKVSIALILVLSLTFAVFSPFHSSSHSSQNAIAKETMSLSQAQHVLSQQTGHFIENKGQWDPEILFMGDTDFGKVAFTNKAIYYQMIQVEEATEGLLESKLSKDAFPIDSFHDPFDPFHRSTPRSYSTHTIELAFVQSQTSLMEGYEPLTHDTNYFIGNDPSKWATECKSYQRICYTNVWEGIDLAYFFTPEGLKYEYYVHPYANMEDLKIQVVGADLSHEDTLLAMHTSLGSLQDDHLLVYGQNTQIKLPASFKVDNNTFTFAGIPEERTETVVIDPLVYSTYLGGSEFDRALIIKVDRLGNAIIAGETTCTDFPMTIKKTGAARPPGFNQNKSVWWDAFVIKLNSNGNELLYSTFIGGKSKDQIRDMKVDENGCIYLVGKTWSEDFPMGMIPYASNAPGYSKKYIGGDSDAFAMKFNASGTLILYSTYLGGTDWDYANCIEVDSEGNLYVGGFTSSKDFYFTKTINSKVKALGYNQEFSEDTDAFLVKLNSNGTELLYGSFFGATGNDEIVSIAIVSDEYIVVTGNTRSYNFPMTRTKNSQEKVPGYCQSFNGNEDLFLLMLSTFNDELIYATFIGGNGDEWVNDMIVNSNLDVYICGATQSQNFPMTRTKNSQEKVSGYCQKYDNKNSNPRNAFFVKINISQNILLYSSFFGGTGRDSAKSFVIDKQDNVYMFGTTDSNDFSMTRTINGSDKTPGFDKNINGEANKYGRYNDDLFVLKFNTEDDLLLYATFLGGSDDDYAGSMDTDQDLNLYLTGTTSSKDLPITKTKECQQKIPGYDQMFNGGDSIGDGFAIKLKPDETIMNPKISVSSDSVGFGSISYIEVINPQDLSQTLTLSNTGEEPLTATLSISSPALQLDPDTIELEPDTSQDITLTLDPSKIPNPGPWESELIIQSNDPDHPNLTIPITAYLLHPPQAQVSSEAFDFGSLSSTQENDPETLRQTFILSNTGEEPLKATLSISSPALQLSSNAIELKPDASQDITLTLDPTLIPTPGPWESKLILESNDPEKPKLIIPITAYLLHPPQLKLPTQALSFGQLAPALRASSDSPSALSLTFTNTGEESLKLDFTSFPSWLSINPSTATLDPQASQEVSFQILSDKLTTLKQYGLLEAMIQGTSNDPAQTTFSIPLTATYGILLTLRIGSSTAILNQEARVLDVPPQIIQGRTLVPLRFISETFGITVNFTDHSRNPLTQKHQILLWNHRKLQELFVNQSQAFHQPLPVTLPASSPGATPSAKEQLAPQAFTLPQSAPPILAHQQVYLPLSWLTSFLELPFSQTVSFLPAPTNEVQLTWTSPEDQVKRLYHFWYDSKKVIIEYPDHPKRPPTVHTLEHIALPDPQKRSTVLLYLSLADIQKLFSVQARYHPTTPNEVQLYRLKQDQMELIRLWINQSQSFRIQSPQLSPLSTPSLDVPPQIIQGRTLVPLRFISETFGAEVTWEAKTQEITITWGG